MPIFKCSLRHPPGPSCVKHRMVPLRNSHFRCLLSKISLSESSASNLDTSHMNLTHLHHVQSIIRYKRIRKQVSSDPMYSQSRGGMTFLPCRTNPNDCFVLRTHRFLQTISQKRFPWWKYVTLHNVPTSYASWIGEISPLCISMSYLIYLLFEFWSPSLIHGSTLLLVVLVVIFVSHGL